MRPARKNPTRRERRSCAATTMPARSTGNRSRAPRKSAGRSPREAARALEAARRPAEEQMAAVRSLGPHSFRHFHRADDLLDYLVRGQPFQVGFGFEQNAM